jgi:hypothetical protein
LIQKEKYQEKPMKREEETIITITTINAIIARSITKG